jgi:hypothetical protein
MQFQAATLGADQGCWTAETSPFRLEREKLIVMNQSIDEDLMSL